MNGLFCSTIIPTVGRPSLDRAVASVQAAMDRAGDCEAIVVNDSGRRLSDAAWQDDTRVRIINTQKRERSVARNAGAAVAHGRYLHFLDDDDWLAPDALQQLRQLTEDSQIAWCYGSTQLVDRNGRPLIQLHHRLSGNCFLAAMAGEWIPLQASLVDSRVFFALGGFNPLLNGPEDVDLLRRVALQHDLAGIESAVAYVERGDEGSTTNYHRHPEQSRWAREKILAMPGCFARLRSSANGPFWHGRISRIYLTSLVWNLQHRRLLTAASRAVYALSSLVLAGAHLLSPAFWQSAAQPYASPTFARGFDSR